MKEGAAGAGTWSRRMLLLRARGGRASRRCFALLLLLCWMDGTESTGGCAQSQARYIQRVTFCYAST